MSESANFDTLPSPAPVSLKSEDIKSAKRFVNLRKKIAVHVTFGL